MILINSKSINYEFGDTSLLSIGPEKLSKISEIFYEKRKNQEVVS